jgi:preprotein translocase subunit SecY
MRRRARRDARTRVGNRLRGDARGVLTRELLLRRAGVGVVLPGGDVEQSLAVVRRQVRLFLYLRMGNLTGVVFFWLFLVIFGFFWFFWQSSYGQFD